MNNDKMKDWTRRKFITTVTSAGTMFLFSPFVSLAAAGQDDKVKKIAAKAIGIDTHNHMDVPFSLEQFKGQQYDLAGEMKASGLTAICMTFCVDRPKLEKEGDAYERFITSLDEMDEMLKANHLTRALNYSDLKKVKKENKRIVIQSIEGGHFIEGKIERIKIAYDRGLRHLGLMHDGQTSPPMGDIYTDTPQFGGLTQLGIDTIKECNRLGILVDLAHCSNEAINKALEVSTKPMLISHTGLNTQLGTNERMVKMMMPRLISKEQAKKFAHAGGVIGVWTHLADTPLDYAKNIRALVDVIGAEHVCIGTDTKMALPGGSNDRFGSKTNQSWNTTTNGFFYTVVDALLKTGFTEKEITQIGGENYCRIFDKATDI
ncbi:peptidase M19 [Pedobacter sp. HMF7647]|uniref:Peptidase M19 n=1 Tax=Hufsiella arboris TaxID=2695275 RepID=A0A7K1Y677_9SPHI|nr:membrane dipeptidase [Hufsiella arboris]MXV50075.1 peptidase M19 [Hufsiella arboris]